MLDKIRYIFLGSIIQKNMERSERAGYEAAKYSFEGKLQDRDNRIKELMSNIDQLAHQKLCETTFSVDPTYVVNAITGADGKAVRILLGGEQASVLEIKNLKEEVKFFKNSRLFRLLMNTKRQKAQEMMFIKSTSFDDMRSGKMCLFNIDLDEKILKAIESIDVAKK